MQPIYLFLRFNVLPVSVKDQPYFSVSSHTFKISDAIRYICTTVAAGKMEAGQKGLVFKIKLPVFFTSQSSGGICSAMQSSSSDIEANSPYEAAVMLQGLWKKSLH